MDMALNPLWRAGRPNTAVVLSPMRCTPRAYGRRWSLDPLGSKNCYYCWGHTIVMAQERMHNRGVRRWLGSVALGLAGLVLACSSPQISGSPSASSQPAPRASQFADLAPAAAHQLIQQESENLVILDVRTPPEFDQGYLDGARNLDFYADDFAQQLAELPRDRAYLVYCRRGVRSRRTLALMQELGFTRVYNLAGGVHRWQADGF